MDITLFPYQEEHVRSMLDILKRSPFVLDFSALGTGKTFTASQLYRDLGLSGVIVIAPVSVKTKWGYMKKHHGINVTHSLSYNELRSIRGCTPKHGLLKRSDVASLVKYNKEMVSINRAEFSPTCLYQNLVKTGIMLVLDEIQNIKNMSAQFQACRALVLEISRQYKEDPLTCKSRVVLISGSPIDKKEHVINIFKCLNVMTREHLCERLKHVAYKYDGMYEIIDYCSSLEDAPIHIDPPESRECAEIAYQLFQNTFKRHICRSMDPPHTVGIRKFNGFFEIGDPSHAENLRVAVNALGSSSQFNPITGSVAYHSTSIGSITRALMSIEFAKLDTFIRLAETELLRNRDRKVVICISFKKSMSYMYDYFNKQGHDTLLLNGSQTSCERGRVLNLFQRQSSDHRILICNIVVCNSGIDLDDKHGSYPRTVFVSPIYNTITLYQLCHRFQRVDSASAPDVYMVYGSETPEHSIISSLGRKSTVMKETTQEQAASGIIFPGDFPSYHENNILSQTNETVPTEGSH